MSRAKLPPPMDGGRSRAPRFRSLVLALVVAASALALLRVARPIRPVRRSSDGKAASVDGKDVAVVSVADSNPWAAVFNRVVKERLTAEGANVTVTGDTDPAGQVQLLNQAVSENPDLIILEALDSKAVAPAIAKAKAQKIAVLNADGKADPSVAKGPEPGPLGQRRPGRVRGAEHRRRPPEAGQEVRQDRRDHRDGRDAPHPGAHAGLQEGARRAPGATSSSSRRTATGIR